MHSQRRSLSVALDMVEAAISSLENQARQAKLFKEQQELDHDNYEEHTNMRVSASYPDHDEQALKHEGGDVLANKTTKNKNNNKSAKQYRHSSSKSIHLHKRHKSGRKNDKPLPGVLLHHRSSKKKDRKHSGSRHQSNNYIHSTEDGVVENSLERNNNIPTSKSCDNAKVESSVQFPKYDEELCKKSSSSFGYLQPTLSSKHRELSSEKPKKVKHKHTFIPDGSQGKSFHVGVIIQKELGQLKSQPLEVWAANKHK